MVEKNGDLSTDKESHVCDTPSVMRRNSKSLQNHLVKLSQLIKNLFFFNRIEDILWIALISSHLYAEIIIGYILFYFLNLISNLDQVYLVQSLGQ